MNLCSATRRGYSPQGGRGDSGRAQPAGVENGDRGPAPTRILTQDATRHDWDPASATCTSCGVAKEFVQRFGATYCKARLP